MNGFPGRILPFKLSRFLIDSKKTSPGTPEINDAVIHERRRPDRRTCIVLPGFRIINELIGGCNIAVMCGIAAKHGWRMIGLGVTILKKNHYRQEEKPVMHMW